jgi:serine protease
MDGGGVIVKFRAASPRFQKRALSAADIAELADSATAALTGSRVMSGNRHVLQLHVGPAADSAEAVAARLRMLPEIEYAEPDRRKFPHQLPNDELYPFQWNYSDPVAGINLPAAWDITTGSTTVVIAIADTGSRPHPDAAKGPAGYDFISDPFAANDGDGRDASPVDTGDGVTPTDVLTHPDLVASVSSWHGESVAGLAGAIANNTTGIAGVDWNAAVLHVRVLGKGGGADSDILDGINWAAGFHVPGVPDNPYPAQIINMSLGGSGACGAAYQDTFDALIAAGKIIVVSAGNNNADVANTSPANCGGAIVIVTATDAGGGKASYSNFGTVAGAITLAAPGGDGAAAGRILSLSNTGDYAPANESYVWKLGTSFAAPQVSGTVALMLAVNPALTPAQAVQILRDTARPFPHGTANDCQPVRCGAGILDAHAAVAFARQTALAGVAPAAGWWWNPNAAGIAFSIEKQGNNLLFAGDVFDASGRATWYASGPGSMNGAGYLGTLMSYGGGESLLGAYQPAVITGTAGDVSLSFSSPAQGILGWPGGNMPIQRLDFGPGGSATPAPAGTPQAGWWWSPGEGGRGYAIEIQGNVMLVAAYLYDSEGNPLWYTSGPAPMTDAATYQGQWQQYANGQTLTGAYRKPQLVNANAGAVILQFDSEVSATMTLPDGRQIRIQRYHY